jgi:hypothetical protein
MNGAGGGKNIISLQVGLEEPVRHSTPHRQPCTGRASDGGHSIIQERRVAEQAGRVLERRQFPDWRFSLTSNHSQH